MLVRALKWKEIYNKKIISRTRNNSKSENKFRSLTRLHSNTKQKKRQRKKEEKKNNLALSTTHRIFININF